MGFFSAIGSDSLSPMLVKELRQGVKSRSFALAFMGLQALMALAISMQVLLADAVREQMGLTVLFWCCVGTPVLVILPFSALLSVQEERRGNTIELLHLTRLTPWRMVMGKWLSVMDRSLLLLAGVLPYLLFRYFVGGVNVAFELVLFAFVGLLAALETAICLFLSSLTHPFLRWGLGLVLLFIVGIPSIVLVGMGSDRPDQLIAELKPGLVLTVLSATAATTLHFLASAASLIAPGAISYEIVKRLTSLFVIAMVALFAHLVGEPDLAGVAIFVVTIASYGAITETPRLNPMLFRRFSRNLGLRVLGRFFHPGWPTGVVFTMAAFLVFYVSLLLANHGRGSEEIFALMTLGGIAALLSALATVLAFRPDTEHLAGLCLLHLFVQLGLGIALLMGGYQVVLAIPPPVLSLAPLAALLAALDRSSLREGILEPCLAAISLASLGILIWRSAGYWRGVLSIERRWIAAFATRENAS